mmetsp:Transcript_28197/g.76105  ORF Transcript_28197/g.76105 Transcript_28197/m.76105 type:complete len:321 (-) Transcript_28197:729-1691(-)
MRVYWSMSPWMPAALTPAACKVDTRASTLARWEANTIMSPSSTSICSFASSQLIFSASSLQMMASWRTSRLAIPSMPTVMCTGLVRASATRRWILRGIVALNSRVWRSGRIWPRTDLTCVSKPISNMRSASSSTRYVVRTRVHAFMRMRSISRPGVATAISQPFLRSFTCSYLDSPPNAAETRILYALANLRVSLWICSASSRVGARIKPIGPLPLSSSRWSMMCTSIGSTKAAVLPLPVLATPSTSRPLRAAGSAWDWMAVGRSYPALEIAAMSCASKPHCWKVLMGLGGAKPATLISSWLRRAATSPSSMANTSGLSS